jgi:coproporphyrinogen III oxidase-like Fe-S oxidoreductase
MWIRQEPSLLKGEKAWADTGNTKRHTQDPEQLRWEAFSLGLRTKKEVDLDDFKNKYDWGLSTQKRKYWQPRHS